jgi:5-(carboxyamino)imidazole ribonucleotide synthase
MHIYFDILKNYDGERIVSLSILDFDKEIAVIVARNSDGQISTFPVVEMVFNPVYNLVEYLFSPAQISDELVVKAQEIAK